VNSFIEEVRLMYCPYCGKELADNVNFCSGCGKKVNKECKWDSPNEEIRCPKCNSNQITAGNKGFGLGKAAAGGLLLGPVGLLGGVIGSKKVMITCLRCGYKWEAGER
jgi:tellurium resistance protein TerD